MDLFRWMGVGTSHQTSSESPRGPKAGGAKHINKADYKQFGLENFGNTCYANSVLQALYFCQPFRELVCDAPDKSNSPIPSIVPPISPTLLPASPLIASHPSRPPGLKFRRRDSAIDGGKSIDDPLANGHAGGLANSVAAGSGPPIPAAPPTLFSALRSLFLHIALNPSEKGTVSPTSFINKVKKENELYRSTMHQDAHEFLGFLLNKIVEDLEAQMKSNQGMGGEDLSSSIDSSPSASTSTTSPSSQSNSSVSHGHQQTNRTFVHSLFEGTLTSETRCLTCETVSSRDESFLDLSIDIEQNSSITACLRQFSASEMLSQKNKFFCDSCGGLQEAEKRMKIKKLPNVLALHLKRFKYQEDVQKYIKLSYRVAFPFELRLFNTVDDAPDPDRLYQLFAIVVHRGGGPHHGHYIAIIKAHGTWLLFDDDNVEPIREVDIPKYFGESPGGEGYVLFYQAVDLDLASLGIDTEEDAPPDAQAEAEPAAEADGETVASVLSSAPPGPLKVEIPKVVEPQPEVASAVQTIAPSLPSATAATPNGSSSPGFFSGVSLGRTLRHSQSVKMTVNGEKERDKRLASSSTDQRTLEGEGKMNEDVPPVPWTILGSPLTHSRSLKGKDKDKDVGPGGKWFSTRKKDKKDKRSMPALPVAVPSLPASALDTSGTPPGHAVLGRDASLSERIATDEESDGRSPRPAPSRSSVSSITLSSNFAPSASSTSSPLPPVPPLPPLPPPSSFPSDALSSSSVSSTKPPSRPATSPSSLPSPSALTSVFQLPDSIPPVPAPVPSVPAPQLPPPPIPSSRTRRISQNPPPPLPSSPTPERPSTAGAKPKRASRKMSLTAMPLAGIFGRKDKDRERAEKDKLLPLPIVSMSGSQGGFANNSAS